MIRSTAASLARTGATARCVLVVAALPLGCSASGPAFESVPTLPDAGRHPPGVSVDPPGELPARVPKGHTERGVLVLGTPTDPETIRNVVRAYFRAIIEESPSELDAVLAPRAVALARSRQLAARDFLLSRFARHDYGSLRGITLYRENELEVSAPDANEGRERAARAGLDPDADQRIVKIAVLANSPGHPRLFGDEIVLRLVSAPSGWTILEIVEDF